MLFLFFFLLQKYSEDEEKPGFFFFFLYFCIYYDCWPFIAQNLTGYLLALIYTYINFCFFLFFCFYKQQKVTTEETVEGKKKEILKKMIETIAANRYRSHLPWSDHRLHCAVCHLLLYGTSTASVPILLLQISLLHWSCFTTVTYT